MLICVAMGLIGRKLVWGVSLPSMTFVHFVAKKIARRERGDGEGGQSTEAIDN
jgi:hypothetical protein